ncbi:hypothetical protein EG329_007327 [Mollisiaceae sp. DMI_Dod_QoI]|nr:hypothetical protein EG329_007327 [Helotiales sp. DMI_Dod_QoI]
MADERRTSSPPHFERSLAPSPLSEIQQGDENGDGNSSISIEHGSDPAQHRKTSSAVSAKLPIDDDERDTQPATNQDHSTSDDEPSNLPESMIAACEKRDLGPKLLVTSVPTAQTRKAKEDDDGLDDEVKADDESDEYEEVSMDESEDEEEFEDEDIGEDDVVVRKGTRTGLRSGVKK